MSNTLCRPIAVFYENEIVIEVDLPKQFDDEKEAHFYADLNWQLYLLPTGKIGNAWRSFFFFSSRSEKL